jgi:hypothetical protein
MKAIDLVGKRFGRLVATECAGPDKNRNMQWVCVCDCGNVRVLSANALRTRNTTSCGCRFLKHGHARHGRGRKLTRTYNSWMSMIQRCNNPKAFGYRWYGALGITVCPQWQGEHGFETFLRDKGERPEGMTLDRWPNPAGNYTPENTRWSTLVEQAAHKRRAVEAPNPLGGNDPRC